MSQAPPSGVNAVRPAFHSTREQRDQEDMEGTERPLGVVKRAEGSEFREERPADAIVSDETVMNREVCSSSSSPPPKRSRGHRLDLQRESPRLDTGGTCRRRGQGSLEKWLPLNVASV